MRFALASLSLLILTLTCTVSAQSLYRWVDKEGKVHYSQQPPARDDAKSVEQRKFAGSVVEAANVPYALQQAMKNFPVTLFVSPGCQQGCTEARDALSRRGVPFREVNVADDATNQLLRAATGGNKIPAVQVGTQSQVGFNPESLATLLDTAGYPRTPSYIGKPPPLPPLAGTAGANPPTK